MFVIYFTSTCVINLSYIIIIFTFLHYNFCFKQSFLFRENYKSNITFYIYLFIYHLWLLFISSCKSELSLDIIFPQLEEPLLSFLIAQIHYYYLRFHLPNNVFNFILDLKNVFGIYGIFGWHFIYLFQQLNSIVCLHTFFFSDEKEHGIHIIVFFICNVSSLVAFRIFTLFLVFSSVTIMCLGMFFFVFILLEFAEILESVSQCFSSNFGKILIVLFLNIFFCLSFTLFSFWGSNYMHVEQVVIFSQVLF